MHEDQVMMRSTQSSRGRAVLTGASVGMVLAGAPVLAALAHAAAGSTGYREIGITPLLVVGEALPVIVVLGAIIGIPTAALLVFAMTTAAKRWHVFDLAVTWAAVGALLTLPLAFAAAEFTKSEEAFSWLFAYAVAIGAASALAAWRVRLGPSKRRRADR